MPTFPEPVDDLDDLDLEDAFGHPVSVVRASPRDRPGVDDDGDVDDLDV
ncbi:hypothetical protein [Curtobacterium sp. VKM Ac-1376]|nr:hypothetical protein [Curtobacterium sp. VKM Ac-1376]MBF4615356.1 hypothetical protein [Curtobacterium sp. VKM Ac-1376]